MQTLTQHRITVAQEQEGLDVARISAISAALAIHIIAAGVLMAPTQMPASATVEQNVPITFVLKDVKPTEPPPVEVKEVKREPVVAEVVKQRIRPDRVTPPDRIVPHTGGGTPSNIVASSNTDNAGPVVASGGGDLGPIAQPEPPTREPVTLAGAQLAYAMNPAPIYPRNALINQIQGTVILEVTVDETGKPISVNVAVSSGSRDLDKAARDQVLRAWKFHPAMQNGRAVRAIGRVPVAFTLN